MAPKTILNKNRKKLSYIDNKNYIKKLNRSKVINIKLRRRAVELSNRNKEISIERNNLLIMKSSLENENNSLRNKNIQFTSMYWPISKKHELIEQTLQKCVPALVTLSQCVPSVMNDIHAIRKFNILDEQTSENKKIKQPSVPQYLSPIVEIPTTESSVPEQTPNRPRNSLFRSPQCKPNLEPYARLKDDAVMLKHSKSVSNKNSHSHQQNENFGEGPSGLYNQSSQSSDVNNTENQVDYSLVSNETPLSASKKTLTLNEVLIDNSTNTSNSNLNNTFSKNKRLFSELISTESSTLRNITIRRRLTRKSKETMIGSDIDNSSTSIMSTRSTRGVKVNYQEKSLNKN